MSFFVKKKCGRTVILKGYSVLWTLCPEDRSVAGTLQPGTECPRTFLPGSFHQGTQQKNLVINCSNHTNTECPFTDEVLHTYM
jgi:hypothetical protein